MENKKKARKKEERKHSSNLPLKNNFHANSINTENFLSSSSRKMKILGRKSLHAADLNLLKSLSAFKELSSLQFTNRRQTVQTVASQVLHSDTSGLPLQLPQVSSRTTRN
jgi:hypothetical protein